MSPRTLIATVLCAIAVKLSLDHVGDADLFWHLRLGLDMLQTGEVPRSVLHTWTVRDVPFATNDWLTQLVFAAAFDTGGYPLLAVVKAAIAALLALTLFSASLRRADGSVRAAGLATALAIFIAATHFATRPTLPGHLLLAVLLLTLEHVAAGRVRAALLLPLLLGLWFNVHGTWAVGLGPCAAALLSALLPFGWKRLRTRPMPPEARRWLLGAAALLPFALLLNPYGAAHVLHPFRVVFGQVAARSADYKVFDEWNPVPLDDPSAWLLFASLALLLFACWRSRRPLPIWDLGVVALCAVMALTTARYHITYALIAAPILAEQLAGLLSNRGFENRRMNLAVGAGAVALVALIAAARLKNVDEDIARTAPVAAMERLHEAGLGEARGFHFYDWGGYVILRGSQSYIDGRFFPFPIEQFREYLRIEREGDVEAVERLGARWLLEPPGSPLAAHVKDREGWSLLYEDERAVLWTRAEAR